MMGTAEYGTARRGVDASLGIAGKTGSCIDKGSWVGLFTSVAPIEQPKYAVAVITRGQSERGKYAAAVAGQVYRALSSHIVRTDRNLAQTEFHIQKRTSIDAKAAAVAEEEDDDAADASAGDNPAGSDGLTVQPGSGIIIVPNPAKQVPVEKLAPKKLITRTGDSKPVFPPVVITYDRSGREQKPNTSPRP
jgi:hypothetical protein